MRILKGNIGREDDILILIEFIEPFHFPRTVKCDPALQVSYIDHTLVKPAHNMELDIVILFTKLPSDLDKDVVALVNSAGRVLMCHKADIQDILLDTKTPFLSIFSFHLFQGRDHPKDKLDLVGLAKLLLDQVIIGDLLSDDDLLKTRGG